MCVCVCVVCVRGCVSIVSARSDSDGKLVKAGAFASASLCFCWTAAWGSLICGNVKNSSNGAQKIELKTKNKPSLLGGDAPHTPPQPPPHVQAHADRPKIPTTAICPLQDTSTETEVLSLVLCPSPLIHPFLLVSSFFSSSSSFFVCLLLWLTIGHTKTYCY